MRRCVRMSYNLKEIVFVDTTIGTLGKNMIQHCGRLDVALGTAI